MKVINILRVYMFAPIIGFKLLSVPILMDRLTGNVQQKSQWKTMFTDDIVTVTRQIHHNTLLFFRL